MPNNFRAPMPAKAGVFLSEAPFNVRRDFNVPIPMRDGVKLAADVQRPDSAGRFPVIIQVKLWAASSAPGTDWVVRLVDVHPDGFAQRLTDGIVRAGYHGKTEYPQSRDDFSQVTPGTLREYTLDLWDISNLFLKGHRIRVEVASGFLPLFSRNLNTGDSSLTTVAMQPAKQTIYHDAAHRSHILLPMVPR